jgi:hypothetical protein
MSGECVSAASSLPFTGSTPTQHSLPDDLFIVEETPDHPLEVNIFLFVKRRCHSGVDSRKKKA